MNPIRALPLILSLVAGTTRQAEAQAAPDSLPPGVTQDLVVKGKTLFTGAGVCFACHGMDAAGGTAPSLADTVWIHTRGEYDKIVQVILSGVDAKTTKSGVVMPPRGGSAITDADVRAVAAYVWSLSRPKPHP